MATTPSRPNTPFNGDSLRFRALSKPTPPAAPASDALAELLHDISTEGQEAAQAMDALVELLEGCQPEYRLSAGRLLALLQPLAGSLQTLCADLRTAIHASSTNH